MTATAERNPKLGQVPISNIELVPVEDIYPARDNDKVYRPVRDEDPAVQELADSIEEIGLKEPIVLTTDNVILSGHRRYTACRMAELEVIPVRREPIHSTDPEFLRLLVEFNRQRDKDPGERIREQLILTEPDDTYRTLLTERAERSRVKSTAITLDRRRERSRISKAKYPFLKAIQKVLDDLEDYWPLSDRRIHYSLCNDPPLIHASKPESVYRNDKASYKAVCELLTRAAWSMTSRTRRSATRRGR